MSNIPFVANSDIDALKQWLHSPDSVSIFTSTSFLLEYKYLVGLYKISSATVAEGTNDFAIRLLLMLIPMKIHACIQTREHIHVVQCNHTRMQSLEPRAQSGQKVAVKTIT